MSANPRWSAVVVNYEAGDLLVGCVRTLLADRSAGRPEVVVVDNGSSDGSVRRLHAALPAVPVITGAGNVGYAAAANRGIAATRAPIVVVCNPDLEVEAGTAAAVLARFEAEADLGAVGPAIFEPDGSRYPSARQVPRLVDAVGHGAVGMVKHDNRFTRRYRQLDADPTLARDVDWVSGASIWLRRTALEAVDGWDAGYFMYVEDVDLCWRLRGAGWRVAYEPGGAVTHVQGASTDRHPYRMIVAHHRSLARFANKRWHGWRKVLLVPATGYLAARAGVAMVARALRPRRGSPEPTG